MKNSTNRTASVGMFYLYSMIAFVIINWIVWNF